MALIERANPASLLVVVESRMGAALLARHAPEDVLQEVLMVAWRDRNQCEWRGAAAFRSWLLTIIDHRIRNLAEHEGAKKRGGGEPTARLGSVGGGASGGWSGGGAASGPNDPADWTTPSQRAAMKEKAKAIRKALNALPSELAEIIRLRVHEQMTIDAIAAHVGLDEAAVRRRFRKGLELYEQALEAAMAEAGFSSSSGTGRAGSPPVSAS
jgi:RNA polymerase sigma factor (sigma-70 family)